MIKYMYMIMYTSNTTITIIIIVLPNREIRLRAKQTITMNENELIISTKDNKTLHFCYDHCFWSFDRNSSDYASQETVYSSLAHPLLNSAFEGYNTCLFAYGQVRQLDFNIVIND